MKLKNPKQKGNGYERELVAELNELPYIKAKRAWGSNGQSLGLHEEVDVLLEWDTGNKFDDGRIIYDQLKLQAKRRNKLPSYLGLTEHVDASVFREDGGESYILLRFSDFIKRFI